MVSGKRGVCFSTCRLLVNLLALFDRRLMRLDIFLNACRLVKRRSEAKRACDNGIVTLDGQIAKAGRDVQAGQRVCIAFIDRLIEFDVVALPRGNVSKRDAPTFYRVVREDVRESEFI